MKAYLALKKIQAMPPDARLLVKDKDGRWTAVEDATFTYVSADGSQPPSHLIIEGIAYVRADLASLQGAA